jgi:hypothetical protein
MINWPDSLIADLARRKCVLFLGAGVSMNSVTENGERPPGWREFLSYCLTFVPPPNDHIQKLIESDDLLTACELLKEKLADEWNQRLADRFVTPKYPSSHLHREIFKLDSRIVLTQNFDKIYDVYAQAETSGSTMIKLYYDADTPMVLRGNYRAVIKVHGTIDEPSKMIFTREDYVRLRYQYRAFQSLIDALFLTHTFLFIGCSLVDPDLRLFLEQHAYAHPSAPPHYMTAPSGEVHGDLDSSIKRNMNLRLLRYEPTDGHRELTESVEALVEAVEQSREAVAVSQDW